jgi:hypothetical protein
MCICQALFTWRFLPETKGRTLEEIEGFWILRPGDRLQVGEVSPTGSLSDSTIGR